MKLLLVSNIVRGRRVPYSSAVISYCFQKKGRERILLLSDTGVLRTYIWDSCKASEALVCFANLSFQSVNSCLVDMLCEVLSVQGIANVS